MAGVMEAGFPDPGLAQERLPHLVVLAALHRPAPPREEQVVILPELASCVAAGADGGRQGMEEGPCERCFLAWCDRDVLGAAPKVAARAIRAAAVP
ncbi:hypothetical protein Mam01_16910 [Microbispora amethystogenes]|uniref:Uncharacterized protein n=1 Tax=Microbispora amethystogenes TaxID=1427754 RepID=A0ABQ4F9N0_9ACTN|nr:hypothetical protein Mam01_16910 [Microbispora amethystogenes]